MIERIKLSVKPKESSIKLREFISTPIKPEPEIPEDGETRKPYPADRDPEGYDESWLDVYHSMGVDPYPYQ